MNSCIFCKIVESTSPSQKVYEDDKVIGFLSIQPIRPGHTLVVPKVHKEDLFSLPEEDYIAVMKAAYSLAPILGKVYKPKKLGVLVAGWDVPHVHVHLIPMHDHHDITSKRLLDGTAVIVNVNDLVKEREKITKEQLGKSV